ncbi:hypothetical protein [Gemmiger sp.]|uniref:hypothetical protein n=1 Tax=Gemmiger sp. TaxID=2049027 RepID=UPI003AB803E6
MMVLLLFAVLLLLLYNFPLHHATKKSRRAKSRREGGQLMAIIQTRRVKSISKLFCIEDLIHRGFI